MQDDSCVLPRTALNLLDGFEKDGMLYIHVIVVIKTFVFNLNILPSILNVFFQSSYL